MKLFPLILVLFYFSCISISIVRADLGDAQNGTVGGADGGYTDGSGPSQGGGEIGSYDNSNQDLSNSPTQDASDTTQTVGTEFTTFISEQIGLGQEAGIESNPGAPAPLSNQNPTIDNGVIASYDAPDPGGSGGVTVVGSAPILSASTNCIGYTSIVHLTWTTAGVDPRLNNWVLLRSGTSGRLSSGSNAYVQTSYDDLNVSTKTIYYYRVYLATSGLRSPLSNIISVYTPSCPVSGYVYNDVNLNGVFDNVDTGIPGEEVQVIRYSFTQTPAYTEPGWTEITSTDENGNPTGSIDHPPVFHPAVIIPDTVISSGTTDSNGHYSIPGIPASSYFVRHNKVPLPEGWVRTTPNDVTLPASNPPISFGLSVPPPPPPPPPPSPPPPPTVNLWLNSQPGNDYPLAVKQEEQVTLRWEVTNANSCIASSTSSVSPDPYESYWTGSKDKTSGTQAITTRVKGTFVFLLTCTNPRGDSASNSIQLIVEQLQKPYIQTTGGDVHTNESISIPQ